MQISILHFKIQINQDQPKRKKHDRIFKKKLGFELKRPLLPYTII